MSLRPVAHFGRRWALLWMGAAAALVLLVGCGPTPETVRPTLLPPTALPPAEMPSPTPPSNTPWPISMPYTPSPTPTPRPTTTLTPSPTPPKIEVEQILDREQAIAYSYKLLQQRGLESEFSPDNANFALVRFPNGDQGVFVALGYFGPTHGYQFLYRIRGNEVELVDLVTEGANWGDLADGKKADIEFLDLFSDIWGRPERVLKVTGSGHAGTDQGYEGIFQIIRITGAGIKVIFSGYEAYHFLPPRQRGWTVHYQYEYVDLNGDGEKEIIEKGEVCYYDNGDGGLNKLRCESLGSIYRFNGDEYVEFR
jgi:hypothetical protein